MPRTQTWTQRFNKQSFIATLSVWPTKTAGAAAPEVVARLTGNKNHTDESLVTVSGRTGRRYIVRYGTNSQAVVSVGLGGGMSVSFTVLGDNTQSFDDPMIQQFFAGIEITSGTFAPPVAADEWPSQVLSIKAPALTISAPVALRPKAASGVSPPGVTMRIWQADQNLIYTVIVVSQDRPPARVADRELDQLCDGFVAQMKFGKEKSRAAVPVGGQPGRKMAFTSGGKDIYYRATIVGSEVFTLTVAGRSPLAEDDQAITKFFESARIK
jgi:hypothetical protein